MKQIILIVALSFGTLSFAQVKSEKQPVKQLDKQSTATGEPATTAVTMDNDKRVEQISAEYDLSSEQKEKLNSILVKNDHLTKENQGNDAKIKEQNKEMEKEFRSILTPEQQKKFDQKQKENEMKKSSVKHQEVKTSKSLKSVEN